MVSPVSHLPANSLGKQRAQDRVARPALCVAEARTPGRDAAQEDGQASLGELAAPLAPTSQQVAAAMARPPNTPAEDGPLRARLARRT